MNRGVDGLTGSLIRWAVCAALLVLSFSCDDGTTDVPDGAIVPTLSLTLDDSTRMEFSGAGAWPPAGTGVIARMDSSGATLQIAAYRQTAGKTAGPFDPAEPVAEPAGPEPDFDLFFFEISDSTQLAAGVYLPDQGILSRNIPVSDFASLGYRWISGSVTLTSVTAEKVTGTFFGSGVRLSDSDTMRFGAGTFEAAYGRGLFSGGDTGSVGGDIGISVDTGVVPVYSWAGGPVFAVSVARAASPTALVWGVVTAGGDSIASGVAHGSVPAGAMGIANTEPVLTRGVVYRVTCEQGQWLYGYGSL